MRNLHSISIDGITLHYDAREADTAELIQQACSRSIHLLREGWNLHPPNDCRVYIMTSWQGFLYHSAPLVWKLLLAITWPLWFWRFRKLWPLAGGWELSYGRRHTVGVKPPALLEASDKRLGSRIFMREEDASKKIQHITCHELTHAFTSHLRLPAWIKEGLAMLVVDRYFEAQTVRADTLHLLESRPAVRGAGNLNRLRLDKDDNILYLYASGYWMVRYLDEQHPELLRQLLSKKHKPAEITGRIATTCGLPSKDLQNKMNEMLVSHFKKAL